MGEVYRARDSRIAREVAVKLLPEALAEDPDRLRRFEQEARAAGALNHPNILAIYDVGSTDGRSYIVFELLEGETLRDRLAPGPLPVRRAVDFALQICSGLAAAHQKGIIHRDLKPENLFLTRDGRVKILDFGLARQADSGAAGKPLTQMPTSAPSTEPGIVMGTVGYMSPEQVRGKTADARSDVFALGAILYEMLTGRRAFRGATAADTMSAILREEPADPSASNAQVPLALDKIVAHCLGKEPEERYQAARDVAFALETFSGLPVSSGPTPAVPSSRWKWTRTAAVALAGLAVLAAGAAVLVWGWRRGGAEPATTAHLVVELPSGVMLPMDVEHPALALSPDGARLVFVGDERGVRRLYLRDLSDPVARPLEGTEGAADPVFLPDGAWVSFFSGVLLKKVAVAGGVPLAIHAATPATVNRGATWTPTDTVVYAASPNSGLSKGRASVEPPPGFDDWSYITRDHNAPYGWPFALPGGDRILFTDATSDAPNQARVSVLSLSDGREATLVNGGTNPRFALDHLLFARAGALYAVPFDVRRARTTGPDSKMLDGVVVAPNGAAQYAVAGQTLAYIAGPPVSLERELVWVDRAGRIEPLRDDGRFYEFPRLSPDGTQLAVTSLAGANYDVWILGLRSPTSQPVTRGLSEDFEPVWHPNGARLVIASEQEDDEGPAVAWTTGPDFKLKFPLRTPGVGNWEFPTSWSRDGKWVAFTRDRVGAASDIEMLPVDDGAAVPVPFAADRASEMGAMFNPVNDLVAYVSDVSGREEVYVRPFPGSVRAVPISTNGGIEPVWSRDGRELFYREGDALKSARVTLASGAIERSAPMTILEGRYDRAPYGGRSANYDVSLDGQRFLFVRRKSLPQPTMIHIVLNWPSALLQTRGGAR